MPAVLVIELRRDLLSSQLKDTEYEVLSRRIVAKSEVGSSEPHPLDGQ
jgi:hypothetical protein